MNKKLLALVILLLLSPFIGELVTGNTPLAIFFSFPLFFLTLILYGGGAILIRETATRWRKGLASIFFLGLAYGAIEEGLVTKGFFDPHFYAVIAFGMEGMGRVGNINVLWALCIMLFHAVFSIIVPIILVDALFGEGQRLSTSAYMALLAVFAVNAFLFNQFLAAHGNVYVPDAGAWLIVCAVIALLIVAARLWPAPAENSKKGPNSLTLFVAGAILSVFYFVLSQGFHNFIHSALANFIVLVVYVLAAGRWLSRLTLSHRGKVSMAAGFMLPMITLGLIGGSYATMVPMGLILLFVWLRAKKENF